MDYYTKYLKYKNKYNQLKQSKQNGGVLIFTENEKPNIYNLLKVESGPTNNIEYNIIPYNFNIAQKHSIKIMINLILPYIKYNGKYLGHDFTNNVNTYGADEMGVLIEYGDLFIKIMDTTSKHIKKIDELYLLETLKSHRYDASIISKYYGFISANKNTTLGNMYNTEEGQVIPNINLQSSLFTKPEFTLDVEDIYSNLRKTNVGEIMINYLTNYVCNDLIFLFFKKK